MKKVILFTVILLFGIPMMVSGQSYKMLWENVEAARKKDLPQTMITALDKIIEKSAREKSYGNLLKAQVMRAGASMEINPDSADAEVEKLVNHAAAAEKSDPVLAAVYNCLLGNVYKVKDAAGGEKSDTWKAYYAKALANPDLLARHKASEFDPIVDHGADSKYFNHDLLSAIGFEAGDMRTLHDYYARQGNRNAAFITALRMIVGNGDDTDDYAADGDADNAKVFGRDNAALLDSLIGVYGDLDICGAAAAERARCYKNDEDKEKYGFLNDAISRWSRWDGVNKLVNMRNEMTAPRCETNMDKGMAYPDEKFKVRFTLRNVDGLTVRLHRVEADALKCQRFAANYRFAYKLLDNFKSTVAFEKAVTFGKHQPYETFVDSLTVDGMPTGVYVVEIAPGDKGIDRIYMQLNVTGLAYVALPQPNEKVRFAVLDAKSGQPVPGAIVGLAENEGNNTALKFKHFTTGTDGEVILQYDDDYDYVVLSTENDKAFPVSYFYLYEYDYDGVPSTRKHLSIFTDRAIYRPGQTVHVTALAYEVRKGVDAGASVGRKVKLDLLNANGDVVGEYVGKTDGFGMVSTDFTLPVSGLTGKYRIREKDYFSSRFIRVEEYKRPTFEVDFDDYGKQYRAGETITVKGRAKSYAEVPVQGAKVAYTITRRKAWWWGWWRGSGADEVELARGETVTDGKGEFDVPLTLTYPVGHDEVFEYNISATVTDAAGESHDGEVSLPLGKKERYFDFSLPELELKDKLKSVAFSLRNAAGKNIDGEVKFTIDGKNERTVKANETVELDLSSIASGEHVMKATCLGEEVTRKFVVFTLDDKVPCHETPDWFYVTDGTFPRDGRPVSVMVGSSDKDVHVIYSIMSGDKVLENGTLELDNSIKKRKFEYKDEYGAGVLLQYAWVKNGEFYTHGFYIRKPLPVKDLNVKWTSFRDRLTPGQKEEWTLCVKTPDGKPAKAQIMATMFDHSLDQIERYDNNFYLQLDQPMPYTRFYLPPVGGMRFVEQKNVKSLYYKEMMFTSLIPRSLFEVFFPMRVEYMLAGRALGIGMMKSINMENDALQEVVVVHGVGAPHAPKEETLMQDADFNVADSVVEEGAVRDKGVKGEVQMRENLNETAFFFPALATDADGNVSLKFTLPESVTTWRVAGLAHDAAMNYGLFDSTAVAKKDVMVQPNMPRFVRMGDRATISTKIFNTSDKDVSGTVTMQLIDPETEKTVKESRRGFSVAKGETGSATFGFDPGEDLGGQDMSLLVCRITASNGEFSDGEQHYLPVLPSKEMVTNTLPVTQNNAGTLNIDLAKMIPSGKDVANGRLTVEYTNNPAWLMVQAIPFVGDVNNKNALSLAAAYYANSLGLSLVSGSPRIEEVFKEWQKETGSGQSLASQLEKNQELKTLVLDETPWVADAKSEGDMKRQIANFFDKDAMKRRLADAVDGMRVLQNSDGSFSWWKGMSGSPCMTAEVMEFLTRLNMLAGEQKDTKGMLSLANDYLSKIVVREVEEFKSLEKQGKPVYIYDYHALQWSYINAVSGRKLTAREKDAQDYLLNHLEKLRLSESMYAKALMAVVLARNGQAQKASEYINSLKEYMVFNEEKGRYFETPRAGYSWCDYRIPTQTAVIEALQIVAPDDTQTIDEMRRWLLTEKRTQAWDTPVNSVNAVYAFLNGNTKLLESQEHSTFKVDGKPLAMPASTAGLGYVKTVVDAERPQTLTVTKTSTGTSWGAVYAQFMQPAADITDASSGLKVKREVVVMENGKEVNDPHTLKVGDKVKVRITVVAERDYDFVQLVDKRAACLEPVTQLSGYHWGYYIAPKDNTTSYYFDRMVKGTHVVEAEYYVDRAGEYTTGTCSVQCAYAPEFSARGKALRITVK